MMTSDKVRQLWNTRIPEFPLSEDQADLWLAIHNEATLLRGLNVTFAKWDRDRAKMDANYLIRYASKTLNNIKARTSETQHEAFSHTRN
jgi:hypothetical protein